MDKQIIYKFVVAVEHLDNALAKLVFCQSRSARTEIFQEMKVSRLEFLIFLRSKYIVTIFVILADIFSLFRPIINCINSHIYYNFTTIKPV